MGAIGSMTIGMMTRTARGHTGRQLLTGKTETLAYTLIMLAAVAAMKMTKIMASV